MALFFLNLKTLMFSRNPPASDCDVKGGPEFYILSFFWVCVQDFIPKSWISKGEIFF